MSTSVFPVVDSGGWKTSLIWFESFAVPPVETKIFSNKDERKRLVSAAGCLKNNKRKNWAKLIIGLRGFSDVTKRNRVEQLFRKYFPGKKIEIIPDYRLIHKMIFPLNEKGIVLSSGTGSFCYGGSYLAGGWGLTYHDPGGSIYLGVRSMCSLLMRLEAGDKFNPFEKSLLEYHKISSPREWIIKKRTPAQQQKLFASTGDFLLNWYELHTGSSRIINDNIKHLGRMAGAVYKNLGSPEKIPLKLHGGLVERHHRYKKNITGYLASLGYRWKICG